MKYLGIDYGARQVGLALSDDDGRLAFPHAVVINNRGLLAHIRSIAASGGVDHIVLGDAVALGGSENAIAADIRTFGASLGEATSLPVSYEAEQFTSQEAARPLALRRGRTTRAGRHLVRGRGRRDASAAALILQRFLDKHADLA